MDPLLIHSSVAMVSQSDDMDINCGTIMDGIETIEESGNKIFNLIIETASGRKTKSEINGYGDEEFNPWIIGATM